MLILAIETSTLSASVALLDFAPAEGSGKILGEHTRNFPGTHSEGLMPAVDLLLRESQADVRDLGAIALALGPGSFTGLRIGVSTVKGLAYALGIPVVGVPTLEGLAHNVAFAAGQICPVLDARKKEVYAALFRAEKGTLRRISEDWVLSPQDLCTRITSETILLGDGVAVYREIFQTELGALALLAPPEHSFPRASNIARLALAKLQAGETLDLHSFTPIYLRRSDAEIHFPAPEAGEINSP